MCGLYITKQQQQQQQHQQQTHLKKKLHDIFVALN